MVPLRWLKPVRIYAHVTILARPIRRSATNGTAEREVRNVLEGTRTLLEHSGLPISYWPYASRCFCHHATMRMVEGDSAWNKRHKQVHVKGEIIPFGALIDFSPPKPILNMFRKFEKRSLPGIFLGYHLMNGERFYGNYLVAPLIDFRDPPTGGVRIRRIAEVITDKAEDCKFLLRESKNKSERSLESTADNKTEDNTPILKELDSTINKEFILEELNEEEDRFEFANNTTWTLTAEERARERAKALLEKPVPEAAALAAPPAEYQKFHQHHLRLELRKLKRV